MGRAIGVPSIGHTHALSFHKRIENPRRLCVYPRSRIWTRGIQRVVGNDSPLFERFVRACDHRSYLDRIIKLSRELRGCRLRERKNVKLISKMVVCRGGFHERNVCNNYCSFFFFPILFLEFVLELVQDGGELWQRYLYKVFYLTRFSTNIESWRIDRYRTVPYRFYDLETSEDRIEGDK